MNTEIIYDKTNRVLLAINEVQALQLIVTTDIAVAYVTNGGVGFVGTYSAFIALIKKNTQFGVYVGDIQPNNKDIILCDDVIYLKIDVNNNFPVYDNKIMDVYFYDDEEMWKFEVMEGLSRQEQAYIRVAPLSVFNAQIQDKFNSKLAKQRISDIIEDMFGRIGLDTPNNLDNITEFIFKDISKALDMGTFIKGDVIIGFRNWVESR